MVLAKSHLKSWCRILKIRPPLDSDPHWLEQIILEAMPEEKYQSLLTLLKTELQHAGKTFPQNPSRKEVSALISNWDILNEI